ncbi:MAG: aromatic ring-hydroxylating dioxygenase subunit alpha [Hyphomicrobiales bacterium]|nr:aromatic ring-hydroxylating dioxygenase subunit alpha [Hyphomicrobiales bacterium]
MITRDDMLASLQQRKAGYTLPRLFYTDAEFFNLDMQLLWYREWLFVAHECELREAGSYVTLQIGDYPILIIRDKGGRIRAFHNTCRHRGSRVCTEPRGKAIRLVCPYHQWVYDHDGSLMHARHMNSEIDKSKFGLKSVACEVLEGFIFINLSDDPGSFAPVRELVAPYLAPYDLKNAKVAFETTVVEKGNWKLVWENNRECYHCAANHPQLCKTFPEKPAATGHAGVANPELTSLWSECERAGLPSRFKADPSFQFRTVRTALVDGLSSYTLSGKPAVSRPISDGLTKNGIGALLLYHYPSTWNHFLRDHAITFRVTPISVDETALTTKWLVHRDAVEGVDYKMPELSHVWTETNDQDRRVVEENARGVASPAYEPGPYSELYEDGVVQFVDWYVAFIEPRLGGGQQGRLRSVA